MGYATVVPPGARVSLDRIDPKDTGGLSQEQADAEFTFLRAELASLQAELYAAHTHAVLMVFQGMDASGKDGAIRRVLAHADPRGCRVENFRAPTDEELAHDFLWRVHKVVPARGQIVAFHRSHYEDVVAARVNGGASPCVVQSRYGQIRDFERMLAANGTIVLKFLLHVSREEQEARLQTRQKHPRKRWKLSPRDLRERERWADYVAAYEDALAACSTPEAPWHVVPADHKWFRNLAVCEAVVEAMRPFSRQWRAAMGVEQAARG